PQDRVLGPQLEVTHLTQGDEPALAIGQGEIGKPGGVESIAAGAACNHFDRADAFADLRERESGQQELQLLCDVGWTQAHELEPALIEHEVFRGNAVSPILIYRAGVK